MTLHDRAIKTYYMIGSMKASIKQRNARYMYIFVKLPLTLMASCFCANDSAAVERLALFELSRVESSITLLIFFQCFSFSALSLYRLLLLFITLQHYEPLIPLL